MMSMPQTPGGRGAPRMSGIPTPGARSTSGIPTPGRPRSTTHGQSDNQWKPSNPSEFLTDADAMRALNEAIRANDPAQHRLTTDSLLSSVSSDASGRRSAAGKPPSSYIGPRASTSSAASSNSNGGLRPKTPSSATSSSFRTAQTPRSSTTSISSRPASRASDVFGRTPSRQSQHHQPPPNRALDLGDPVRIESLGVEGTLQFLGETEFKAGVWAGVELTGQYAGKGKNDGTVNGIRYFDCAPLCGVFVAPTKLSRPDPRPASVVSSYGRATPSGRVTPSLPNGGALNRLGLSTFKTPEPKVSAGSRASKYIGLTAKQLASSREMPGPRIGSTSPSRSPARAVTSTHTTPKATGRPSALGLPGPKPRPSLGSSVSATPRPTPGMTRSRIVRSPVPDLPPTSFLNGSPSRMIRPSGSGSGPFAKPITPTFSQTSSDTFVEELPPESGKSDDSRVLEANARALEDRITKLISGAILANGLASDKSASLPTSPAQSQPTSLLPAGQVQQLLARVEELEHELERVKQAPSPPSTTQLSHPSETVLALEVEKAAALAQVTALEAQANAREASAREEKARLESRLRSVEQITSDVRAQLEGKITQLSALETTVQILKTENSNKDVTIAERGAALNSEKEALKVLEEKMTRTTATLQEDKAELTLQVEELRLAGQETIALYEERLSNSEAHRYELEDAVKSLEDQVKKSSEPISPAVIAARATTAAQIDNQTLHEQVTHLQKKVSTLEEQLDDARSAQERDEQAVMTRITRFRDNEIQFRKDLAEARRQNDEISKVEAVARARVEEVTEALRESDLALEDARAEIETLRVEVSSLEAAQSAHATADASSDDLVGKLKVQLEDAQASLRKQQDSAGSNDALKAQIATLKSELSELQQRYGDALSAVKDYEARMSDLGRQVDQRTTELEAARASPSRDSPSSKYPNGRDENLRDQVTGLKHVVQELTKENAVLSSSNKVLDSDNKMLLNETAELRESLKQLEDTFEQSILREQKALDAADSDANSSPLLQDVATLRQTVKDGQSRHEREMDQMRKQLADMEKKHARTVHDLNKEISELENLVEAKIYREDDLEREIERLKEKLSRRNAKASGESMLSRKASSQISSESERSSATYEAPAETNVCEVCGEKGHDLLTCHLVFNDSSGKINGAKPTSRDDLWCEDCESRGHVTADCPHSQDVF